MLSGEPDRAAAPRRRAKALALLVLAIVLLHLSVLDGIAGAWPHDDAVPAVAAVQVRTLVPVATAPMAAPQPVPEPTAAEAAPPARPEPPAALRRPRPAATVVARVAPMPVDPPLPQTPAGPARAALAVVALAEPAPPAASAAPPAPTVRADPTELPPALTLAYELRRGLVRGSAELRWQPQAEGRYELNFDARVAGFSLLRQVSSGDLGEAGLAPRRFTDQRAGREVRATNFQREAGKITFSGPTTEFPLGPGTQDRLSWMVQLAAVVAADPRRREPGAEVVMAVVGTRADLATWVFRCVGSESVDTPLGPLPTTKFIRERQAAHDTEVEVWLDPAHHHLPARALLHNGPDDTLELLLRP